MPIPQEWNLTGKVAIITADRRGWTPFLAAALAEAGADVAVAGSDRSDMADAVKAVESQGRKSLAIPTDVTSSAEIGSMLQKVISEFGKVDILVNNARVEFGKPFADVTEAEWKTVMDFNVNSMFLCCQAVGKHMLEQGKGRIINISSGLAVRGLWNSVAACASQGAIHQLTSALALEWARSNIKVNAIGAGWRTTDEPTEEDKKD
ncbi:MAG: SDR family NAD(P)-dependent oxidoreductase, partial [Chloroflexi bacterium]|nr:SDR family NAD(P)-dependent oxidoreductase [Chloroflexota bacterium]